jgi:hypothetical protein
MTGYRERTAQIRKMLETKTVAEIEQELGVTKYSYSGVGFGYNLKGNYPANTNVALHDIETPLFDELVSMTMR